jgi:hypothetical protein
MSTKDVGIMGERPVLRPATFKARCAQSVAHPRPPTSDLAGRAAQALTTSRRRISDGRNYLAGITDRPTPSPARAPEPAPEPES